jgi:hypothetical protein
MKSNGNNNLLPSIPTSLPGGWLEIVRRQVATLQFGIVQIIVHESKVVQVERTEKVRIATGAAQTNLTADQPTGGSPTHSGSPT